MFLQAILGFSTNKFSNGEAGRQGPAANFFPAIIQTVDKIMQIHGYELVFNYLL
jgi:hypothetical protein